MASKKVFEFDDYKLYLAALEHEKSHFSRGFRSRLAEEVGCNNAFISQVLNTHANFSLEQSLKICRYFNLSADEQKYFLFLVEYARAGTKPLREHFKAMLDEMKETHLNIKGRVKQQTALSPEAQSTYYSHWYYAAIHMLVTVPQYRTVRTLANWRMVAVQSLQNEERSDIHYSTVSTLSKKDVETLRLRLVEEIQNYVQTVSQSKEETLYCFNLDFFKLLSE